MAKVRPILLWPKPFQRFSHTVYKIPAPFALLYHGRLNTRAHLYHRHTKPLDESWCERCHGVLETDEHIFNGCSTVLGVLGRLHICIKGDSFRRSWKIVMATALPEAVHVDMILLILWHIWNGLIFEHQDLSPVDVLRKTLKDINAWSYRYKKLQA
ncbi:hypothetical protein PAHAL_3G508900 [Panicum hallii]|jgi:hypothetical protein|uniref:Reverse transcriptase zinc-binding domain-containing protein n=1 Tax=Panicum hallii TaxID=206008 RepID=A0A2S3HFQ6_9POAL|nr:hypothetical protein PAHAL_3G508900 [Panicum hallii]